MTIPSLISQQKVLQTISKAGCLVWHSKLDEANKYTSLSSINAELDFFKETKISTENF